MGWLTGWFRRRTDTGVRPLEEAPRADPVGPLVGEAPSRHPREPGTRPMGSGPSTASPTSATGDRAAATAAAGGAILLGAEILSALTAHPAEARTTDPTERSASEGGRDQHDRATERADDPPAAEPGADATPSSHDGSSGPDGASGADGFGFDTDGGGDGGDGGEGGGGDGGGDGDA